MAAALIVEASLTLNILISGRCVWRSFGSKPLCHTQGHLLGQVESVPVCGRGAGSQMIFKIPFSPIPSVVLCWAVARADRGLNPFTVSSQHLGAGLESLVHK